MSKIHVGVLRGGPSFGYDASLKTGGSVLKHLPGKFQAHDILITKDGMWHVAGIPKELKKAIRDVDVIFNALHGEYGEDGKVQQILESHGVPFTGSNAFSSAVAMNKELSKKWFKKEGIKTPLYTVVDRKEDDIEKRALEIFKTFPQPSVVKPISGRSSLGVRLAYTASDLQDALTYALRYAERALVEEFIKGREATCGVIDNFRGSPSYALLPIEVAHFNNEHKTHPGGFTQEENTLMEEIAVKAHRLLGLRHYSKADFIVAPRRGMYLLEINTLPELSPESAFHASLHAVGSNLGDFLDHLITLALENKK